MTSYPQDHAQGYSQDHPQGYAQDPPQGYSQDHPQSYPQGHPQNYQQQGYHQGEQQAPPNPPPRRTDTDVALPQGSDRSHQVEVMQTYEAARPQSKDDANQAILQREFPKIDSSLIAAIYNDTQSLSATREMLMELNTEG